MSRVVVFGSRTWSDEHMIAFRLEQLPADWIIVHGACPAGADAIADRVARRLKRTVELHPADWAKYGKAAGPFRNEVMAALPDVQLGIGFRVEGFSRGTDGMDRLLWTRGIPVERYGWGWP